MKKKIFSVVFVFFAVLSSSFAIAEAPGGDNDEKVSPIMQCISSCIAINGWKNANACVNFCGSIHND